MLNKNCYDGMDIIVRTNKVIKVTRKETREKELNLTIADIRNQLNQIGQICPYNRETYHQYYLKELEEYNLPFMNYIYYFVFFQLLRVPTFEEFVNTYITIYCDQIAENLYTVKPYFDAGNFCFTKEQLMGRIYRSYNSFHREIEFLFQLGSYEGIDIQYRFQDDLNGVDFTVNYNGKTFGIATYIGSNNSYKWKQVKNTSRHNYDGMNVIDVVANFKGNAEERNCDVYNGIYTYSPATVAQIYFEIVQKSEE
jgi:hypothetical protein